MPINYARRLTGGVRTAQADRQLGLALAFLAGAINAGGFLAVLAAVPVLDDATAAVRRWMRLT